MQMINLKYADFFVVVFLKFWAYKYYETIHVIISEWEPMSPWF